MGRDRVKRPAAEDEQIDPLALKSSAVSTQRNARNAADLTDATDGTTAKTDKVS